MVTQGKPEGGMRKLSAPSPEKNGWEGSQQEKTLVERS